MIDSSRVDLGSIQIHKQAIADIAVSALGEIEGVNLMKPDFWRSFLSLLGQRSYRGIHVIVDKNNQVSLELKICVQYGMSIPDIARQIQEGVRNAIERTVDINLKDISVNIQGIERGKS